MSTPVPSDLPRVIVAVAGWQRPGAPVQLHPGDLGWHQRFGADELAGCLRVWARGGQPVAVGFVDEGVMRMAVAPEVDGDREVAERLVSDLEDPSLGALPEGEASVEARSGAAFRSCLAERGWAEDEPWTPLARDLSRPVEPVSLRIEVVGADLLEDRIAVQRAVFDSGRPINEERWRAMAAGPAYERARCLVGYDDEGTAVAMTTVWSSGAGRPGLIEPLGVHRDHRGHGYGRDITLGAAAVLQQLGSSTVTVATPSANTGGVAAYVAAGFTAAPESTDFRRPS